MTAGYSGTPLPKKPGIKPGSTLEVIAETWSDLRVVHRRENR